MDFSFDCLRRVVGAGAKVCNAIRIVTTPLVEGGRRVATSSGALSAFTGSVIGIGTRVSNAIPPHKILDVACEASWNLGTLGRVLASPLKLVSGAGLVFAQSLRNLSSFNPPTTGSSYSDHWHIRRAHGVRKVLEGITFAVVPTLFKVSGLMSQTLYGMTLQAGLEGLASFGKVGLAKTVSLFAGAGLALLNTAYFAQTTEECQTVGTTWANLFGALFVAGSCSVLLSRRFFDRVYTNASEKITERLVKNQPVKVADVLWDQDSSRKLCIERGGHYHAWTSKGLEAPNFALPDWLGNGWQIEVSQQLDGPRFGFKLQYNAPWGSSSSSSPGPSGDHVVPTPPLEATEAALQAIYSKIEAELNSDLGLETALRSMKDFGSDSNTIVVKQVKQGDNCFPAWGYCEDLSGTQKPIPEEYIPQVPFQFSDELRSDEALRIRWISGRELCLITVFHEKTGDDVDFIWSKPLLSVIESPVVPGERLYARFLVRSPLLQAVESIESGIASNVFIIYDDDQKIGVPYRRRRDQLVRIDYERRFVIQPEYSHYQIELIRKEDDSYECQFYDRASGKLTSEVRVPLDMVLLEALPAPVPMRDQQDQHEAHPSPSRSQVAVTRLIQIARDLIEPAEDGKDD